MRASRTDPLNRIALRRLGGAGLAALVALALGACASLEPGYQRPDAPVAASFPGAGDQAADADREAMAADIHWHAFYRDERLRRLIGIALSNNRDLRAAALAIERAWAQYGVVSADRLPSIGLGGVRARQVGPTGQLGNSYTVGLALSTYELDFFGRVNSLGRAALARYLATEEGRRSAQIGLVAAVATAYFTLVADDESIAVLQDSLGTLQEAARLTRLRFKNGVVSEVDVQQATSVLESTRATLAQLRRQRALDENALVLLLGQPIPPDLPKPVSLQKLAFAPLSSGLPSDLLVRRPDIRQAELQLLAANANIGAARAAFFPRISLTANAGYASNQLSGLFDGSGVFTFAAQLLQPIFDAGRNRANLEIARVDRDIAIAQYERSIQSAYREVADALVSREHLNDELRALQAQERAEQARLRLADLRYSSGTSSHLEVLDAQRSLLAVQQAVVRVRATMALNRVSLYRALGGGWTPAELALSRSSDGIPPPDPAATR